MPTINILFTLRLTLFILWLIIACGVIIFALWFILDSGRSSIEDRFHRIAGRWLRKAITTGLVIGLLVIGLAIAIQNYPYPSMRGIRAEYSVEVVGRQFTWILNTSRVPAGVPVEFIVKSVDVNHGFGLYSEDGELIAQVQAMPQYVNRIIVVLDEGRYYIVCLEYCGSGHHIMMAEIRAVGGGV